MNYYYYYYEQSLWTHEKDFKKQKERSAIWTNSTKKCPCWWNDCDPDVKEIAGMSETRKFINAFTCANWIQPIISTSYFLYNHLIITLPLTPPPPNVFFSCHIFRQKFCYTFLNSQLKNKRPTWCHLLFYFTSYVLNMFRTLIYPS